jgi:hypothetical protein
MKPALLMLVACGCAEAMGPSHRFVRTDEQFTSAPLAQPPKVLIDPGEIAQLPPFKSVGVLEIKGNAHDSVDVFLARVSELGAKSGCEVLAQRDLFELTQKIDLEDKPMMAGTMLPPRSEFQTGVAVWQFLCGIAPATDEEAKASRKTAIALAVQLRDKELGDVCKPTTALGSHIKTARVCANAR